MSLAVGGSPAVIAKNDSVQSPMTTPKGKIAQEEIQWALQLESKVKGGYSPKPEEIEKYQELADKLSSNMDKKAGPNFAPPSVDTSTPNKYPEPKSSTNVDFVDSTSPVIKPESINQASAKEVKWALDLESKIKNGHSPTKTEISKYEEIYKKSQTPVDPKSIGEIAKRAKDGVINAGKAVLNTLKTDSAIHHAIGGAAVGAVVGGPVGAAVGATVSFAFSKLFDIVKAKTNSKDTPEAKENQKKSFSFTAAGAALGSVAGPGGALFGGSLGFLASKIKMPEKH